MPVCLSPAHRAGITTSDPDELVARFAAVLSIPAELARFFLDAASNNLEVAINLYLDNGGRVGHRSATAAPAGAADGGGGFARIGGAPHPPYDEDERETASPTMFDAQLQQAIAASSGFASALGVEGTVAAGHTVAGGGASAGGVDGSGAASGGTARGTGDVGGGAAMEDEEM
jgi:hypothetical protein